MHVDRDAFEDGACIALVHAAQLLEDASILFSRKRASSSFHLAVMAREELGRFTLLAIKRNELQPDGKIAARELKKEMSSHVEKLRAARSISVNPVSECVTRRWSDALNKAYGEIEGKLNLDVKRKAVEFDQAVAQALHEVRMMAQYVDFDEETGVWSRPSEVTMKDAEAIVQTVMAQIANTLIGAQSSDWIKGALERNGLVLPDMIRFTTKVMQDLRAIDA